MVVGVMFVICNPEGKMLMQFRDGNCTHSPLKWMQFGGQLDNGESPERAACRELAEELDILAVPSELREIGVVKREKGGDVVVYRYKRLVTWEELSLGEGAGMAFFSLEEAMSLSGVTPLARTILCLVG